MSVIQDVAGRLVQGFLSLDDLVFGQGVVAEGLSQLGLSGRTAAGSVVAGSNVAARTFHAGVQVGAKTAAATAGALEGIVPGAGMARSLAERVDRRAAEAAEEASRLATHAVEMTGGKKPVSPLDRQPWLSKAAPRGYGWGELAADTAVGSLGRLATLPLAAGVDALVTMASSRAGRVTIDSTMRGAGMLLDMLPGAGSTDLDADELRESLMTVAASSGDAAARNVAGLAEAAARMAFGDTRKLRQSLEEAIEAMRMLADHDHLADLLPAVSISKELRRRARSVVEHAPRKLLRALERGPDGAPPSAGAILQALVDDADDLRVFATDYPMALGLMATNSALLMAAGMVDVHDVESFVKDDFGGAETSRPWSATQLEAYAGKAPESDFFDPTARAAQDVVFVYSAETLGRDKALARAERLYGATVRERLENDVSLDLDVLRAKSAKERDRKLREHIAAVEDGAALTHQRELCRDQLESLEAFSRSTYGYLPPNLAGRKDALRVYLSLAAQDLALRGAEEPARGKRQEALEALLSA